MRENIPFGAILARGLLNSGNKSHKPREQSNCEKYHFVSFGARLAKFGTRCTQATRAEHVWKYNFPASFDSCLLPDLISHLATPSPHLPPPTPPRTGKAWRKLIDTGDCWRHFEPIMHMVVMAHPPLGHNRIPHVWMYENFQTLPEGPRAGLKDSYI